MSYLEKLISHASSPLSSNEPILSPRLLALAGNLAGELTGLLSRKNGFYALESALHVLPAQSSPGSMGLDQWNDESLWRGDYQGFTDRCLFFAEDIFGGQFCIMDGSIYTFDPETGAKENLAYSLEGWAQAVVTDYNVLTGFPLAHSWQEENGLLPPGKRLLPKVPFVAGGEFKLENLYLSDAVEGMKFRAHLANQIKDLPDGAQINFNIVD